MQSFQISPKFLALSFLLAACSRLDTGLPKNPRVPTTVGGEGSGLVPSPEKQDPIIDEDPALKKIEHYKNYIYSIGLAGFIQNYNASPEDDDINPAKDPLELIFVIKVGENSRRLVPQSLAHKKERAFYSAVPMVAHLNLSQSEFEDGFEINDFTRIQSFLSRAPKIRRTGGPSTTLSVSYPNSELFLGNGKDVDPYLYFGLSVLEASYMWGAYWEDEVSGENQRKGLYSLNLSDESFGEDNVFYFPAGIRGKNRKSQDTFRLILEVKRTPIPHCTVVLDSSGNPAHYKKNETHCEP